MYKHFFKRIFDFSAALVLFIVTLPLFVIITIILFFANKGKPFFIQGRPGLDEKAIKIIKFKTMADKMDSNGCLLPNHIRITKIGAIIRKFSLDELPQLISVLKGDLSFVGPRPLLFDYLPLYNAEQRKRHNVLPGITGRAQLNAKNIKSWQEKFENDIWYVNNLSFSVDFKIFLLSCLELLHGEGMSQVEKLPRFDGTN